MKKKLRFLGQLFFFLCQILLLTNTRVNGQTIKIIGWNWVSNIDPFASTEAHTMEFVDGSSYIVMNKPACLVQETESLGSTFYKFRGRKTPQITASTFTIVPGINGGKKLMMFGSGKNRANRKLILRQWNPIVGERFKSETPVINTNKFFKKVLRNSKGQFNKLNIQGATSVGNLLVLANSRKAHSWRDNFLVLTSVDFYKQSDIMKPSSSDVRIRKFIAGDYLSGKLTITGLTYVPTKKTLVYLAYKYDSRKVRQYYIGWIVNFDDKINSLELTSDNVMKLTSLNSKFNNKQIESLAFKGMNGNLINLLFLTNDILYNVVLDIKRS